MSETSPVSADPKSQLRRVMGFWDLLLFNIAAVLGPRWIAAASHNGTSSISLWVLAAVGFFVPTAMVIVELTSRFPEEGGLYAWTKNAFGDFHGFVAGWTYWIYTIFYFPALLLASASMSAYVVGPSGAALAQNRMFLLIGSFVLLIVAVGLNLIGLNIGKWLQNAGGVSTYLPLMILAIIAFVLLRSHGSITAFTMANMMPHWNWGTVNFWPQIAFAFTGLEIGSMMSEEVRDPRRTFPRAIFASGALIAVIYIIGTFAVLSLLPAADVDTKSGVFQAITSGSTLLKIGFVGVLAAMLVSVGNAGGVGSTVAGVSRVPFVVGIDRYLPAAFGKIHPKWKTPYVAILVQAAVSAVILLATQINETANSAYQILVDATTIVYFVSLMYMYASAIRLAYRKDRTTTPGAVLIPGGVVGVWIASLLGIFVVLGGIALSFIPPAESADKFWFVAKLIIGTVASVLFGLALYYRGVRAKARDARAAA
ncbi:MAG TPA: APC family permease [Candidatus Acidoferrales bacterium]